MRIRTIKPEFFLHSDLWDLEQECGLPVRLAFIGLWCAADRRGRFKWRPRELKAQILPHDDVDFSRVLHALTTRGFVVRYASGAGEFGWIPSFERHQVINNRESESILPSPSTDDTSTRAPRVPDACATRHDLDQGEGKGREGNKEGKEYVAPAPYSARARQGRPSDVGAVVSLGATIGVSEADCRDWHRDMEAAGWAKVDGTPFGNWQRELCMHRDRLRESRARQFPGRNGTASASKPSPSGSIAEQLHREVVAQARALGIEGV